METPDQKGAKRSEVADKHTEDVRKNADTLREKKNARQSSSIANVVAALTQTTTMVTEQMALQREAESHRFQEQMQLMRQEAQATAQRFELLREAERNQRQADAQRFELLLLSLRAPH